jgi:hypothetical protein
MPEIRAKPISREMLARCVQTIDSGLAEKVRADDSFDVALISSVDMDEMQAELCRYSGDIPTYDSYCGHAVQKAMAQLPYDFGYVYPSFIRLG